MNHAFYLIKSAIVNSRINSQEEPETESHNNLLKVLGLGATSLGVAGLGASAYGAKHLYGNGANTILDAAKLTQRIPGMPVDRDLDHKIISKYVTGASQLASTKPLGIKPLGEILLDLYDGGKKQTTPEKFGRNVHYEQYSKGPVAAAEQLMSEVIYNQSLADARRMSNSGQHFDWQDPAVRGPIIQKLDPLSFSADLEDNISKKMKPEEAIFQASKNNPKWRGTASRITGELANRYGKTITTGRKYVGRAALASLIPTLLGAGLYAAS